MSIPHAPLSEEMGLWHSWRTYGDIKARAQLIERFFDLAKVIAKYCYKSRYSDDIEFGDYMQQAVIGLLEAIDRYDPSLNVAFNTFATYRIKGSILNGLSQMSETRQQISYWTQRRKERLKSIIDSSESDDVINSFENMVEVAIDLALSFMLENSSTECNENDHSTDNLYHALALSELKDHTKTIVDTLPEVEQKIIRYHYFYDVAFEEIARMMQLSKGRISQLHKRALGLIRVAIQARPEVDRYL